jgi:hypothetical protein
VELHMFYSSGFILLTHTGLWRGEVNTTNIAGILRIDVLRARSSTGTGLRKRRSDAQVSHNETH